VKTRQFDIFVISAVKFVLNMY